MIEIVGGLLLLVGAYRRVPFASDVDVDKCLLPRTRQSNARQPPSYKPTIRGSRDRPTQSGTPSTPIARLPGRPASPRSPEPQWGPRNVSLLCAFEIAPRTPWRDRLGTPRRPPSGLGGAFSRASSCSGDEAAWPDTHAEMVASTLYAARGRLMPLSVNSPTGSTVTAFSTFVSTRGLIKICPGLASSQRREATLATVPIAA